jgi:hypothetical protein
MEGAMPGHELTPMSHDYSQRDFQVLFQQTNAGGWADAIDWLRGSGYQLLDPAHAESMLQDIERLQHDDVNFIRDPVQAYDLARQRRVI